MLVNKKIIKNIDDYDIAPDVIIRHNVTLYLSYRSKLQIMI